MRQQLQVICVCFVLSALLGACEPVVHHRGHVEDAPITEKLTVGESNKDDVRNLFGSPSSMSHFGEDTWYYMNARKEAKAFFRPEVTSQRVTQIVFDAQGVVKDIDQYDAQDGQRVTFVEKTTPTEGHSLGFVEQILGNLGRFNKEPSGPGR